VRLESPWDTPSFSGSFLPREREVRKDGFSASWRVLHLNRNYSQSWKGSKYKVEPSAFGVRFLLAVDEYQKSTRAAKYAVMFIGITFLMYFMMEVLGTRAIHPIQYLLVGLALLVFYTLLLAISEHIPFGYAYLIASAAIIGQITLYSRSVLGRLSLMGIVAGVLVILYGFLYIVLQLEDYALLLGSVGIFAILALVMYLTRKVDWYNVLKEHERAGDS
jgi:inner membrane protein